MTTTDFVPASVAAPPAAPARSAPPETAGGLPLVLFGEVLLVLVSVITMLGLRRVFVGTDWFPPLVIQVTAAHTLVAVLRRRQVGIALTGLATLVVGTVALSSAYAWESTLVGIPTPSTMSTLIGHVSDAVAAFSDVKAPTEALPGFLIAFAAAVWLAAFISDWAAFRVDAAIEAVLPFATLFLLAAILGADVDRTLLAGLWISAALLFVLVRRADRLGRTAIWVGERRRAGPRTLVLLGVGLALASVAVAAIVGPRLPGASSDAVVSLTDIGDDGPGTRVTVSPLVDIRSRLVEQADVEVFSVRASEGQYWRLTSLDTFDGRIWSSNGSYGKASADLDNGVDVDAERTVLQQTFSIRALSQIWLPAAYEPQTVDVATPIRYDEVSGTLIVDTDTPTSDNTDYQVTSAIPILDPAALAGASPAIPDDIADQYLALPADFPASVAETAAEVTAGSTNPFEAALALQTFFRDNFTYDLEVGTGHSDDAMEIFVTDLRRGYCEQFAGSFAAMARSLGIPARVAVGFTEGNSQAVDPTLFRVRGEHAHAWPEVYLGQYGWVMFEPTPGRGSAASEAYTGVPEQQVVSGGDPNTATTAPPVTVTTPTDPNATTPTRPQATPEELAAGGETDSGSSSWLGRIAVAVAAVAVIVALYLGLVTGAMAIVRRRRRAGATAPDAKIALAWEESLRAVRRAGVNVRSAETQAEVADRLGTQVPSIGEPIAALATAVESSTYAPTPATDADGDRALALADTIETATATLTSRPDRFRQRFDPRRIRSNLRN